MHRLFKPLFRFGITFFFAALGMSLAIEAIAYTTWDLSGQGHWTPKSLEAVSSPNRHPTHAQALPYVTEWPANRPRYFHQAPKLAAEVKAGILPPVDDRLPQKPLVVHPPAQIGPYGGTFRRLATGPNDAMSQAFDRIFYEGLLRFGPMGRKILPNLAKRWKVSDGGRTFTFWIRKGVKWSDGKPLTVNTIVFWFRDVLFNKDLTPVPPRLYMMGGKPATIKKLNDYTIQFHFAVPNGLFLRRIASQDGYRMFEYPLHYLKQFHPAFIGLKKANALAKAHGYDLWYQYFSDRASRSNPQRPTIAAWMLKVPPPGRPIVFVRNPYYWKVDPEGNQLPYINRLTFGVYDQISTINFQAFSGDVGMQFRHLNFSQYPLMMRNRIQNGHRRYHVYYWIYGSGTPTMISFNLMNRDPVLRKIVQDRRFRYALSYAIDRQRINKVCYYGVARPRQPAPTKISPYYVPSFAHAAIQYDPKKADELLNQMGLTRRNKEGIRLRPDGRPLTIRLETMAMLDNASQLQMIARDWRKVGVATTIKIYPRSLMSSRYQAGLEDTLVWWDAGEGNNPLLNPVLMFPSRPGHMLSTTWGNWFYSGRPVYKSIARIKAEVPRKWWPDIPSAPVRHAMRLYRAAAGTTDRNKQIRLIKAMLRIDGHELWTIGVLGKLPATVVVQQGFHNVPKVALYNWSNKSPGNTDPECYAIGKGIPVSHRPAQHGASTNGDVP